MRLEDHQGEEYKPKAPQFKAFGGAGHMLGSPAPNVTQTTTTQQSSTATAAPTDASRLQQLAQQQLKPTSASSSSTTMRLRLQDIPAPVQIAIGLDRTLADVRRFLTENVPSLQANQFEFIEPPSTKVKREDESKSIAEAKLTNAALVVRRAT